MKCSRSSHSRRPAPRLFIVFNSCTIIFLLLFIVLQGLVLKPLPSVSFLHLILPDHTRHYIHSQTGINAVQIYTTFFATCYQSVSSVADASVSSAAAATSVIKLDCSWHSFYFNWKHFVGVPDVIRDPHKAVASIHDLSAFQSNYATALELHKVFSIISGAILIVTISARFLVMVSCLFPVATCQEALSHRKLVAFYRIFFVLAHAVATPAGVLLAAISMACSSFHIYSQYYATDIHPAIIESTLNLGLHVLLWLVSFFSILDIRAARMYSHQLLHQNLLHSHSQQQLLEALPETGEDNSNVIIAGECPGCTDCVGRNSESSLLSHTRGILNGDVITNPFRTATSNTNTTPDNANLNRDSNDNVRSSNDWFPFRTSTSSNRSVEPSILRNPLFDPFRSSRFSQQLPQSPKLKPQTSQQSWPQKQPFDSDTSSSSSSSPHSYAESSAMGAAAAAAASGGADFGWLPSSASCEDEKAQYKYSGYLFRPGSRQNLDSDSELSDDDDRASTSESLTLSDSHSIRTTLSRTSTLNDDRRSINSDVPPPYTIIDNNSSTHSLVESGTSGEASGTTLNEYMSEPDTSSSFSGPPSLVFDDGDVSSSQLGSTNSDDSSTSSRSSGHYGGLSATPLHMLDPAFDHHQHRQPPPPTQQMVQLNNNVLTFHANYFGDEPGAAVAAAFQAPIAAPVRPQPLQNRGEFPPSYHNGAGCS